MLLKVGTRGSKLALTQTNWVCEKLKEKNKNLEIEVVVIKTKGDLIQNKALDKIGDKGLFVKEIEAALLDGSVDFAVHSMKDMPTENPEGLVFSLPPKREDPRDILVIENGGKLSDLKEGAIVGTGSKRRMYQLADARPDLIFKGIRGNVDTRIRKLHDEDYDAICLAAAGMKRLNYDDQISDFLENDIMLPSPAQGILAIQYKEDNKEVMTILNAIGDEDTNVQMIAERGFLAGINGGCHVPVGAYCTLNDDGVTLEGVLGNEDGSKLVRRTIKGDRYDKDLGYKLADIILKEMANER